MNSNSRERAPTAQMPGVEVLQHLWQLFALKRKRKNLSYPACPPALLARHVMHAARFSGKPKARRGKGAGGADARS
jgi:hypothetical protein